MEKIFNKSRKKSIDSIILAAGEGKRYSKGNKLLHLVSEKPMLQVVINLVKSCNFRRNYLVVNPNWQNLKNKFKVPNDFVILENHNYKKGISSSIKLAISEIITSIDIPEYIAIFLADMPFIKIEDVKKILKYCDGKNKIIAPFYKGKKGFPTFIHHSLFEKLFTINGDTGIKQIIIENPELVFKINFNTDRILKDIDQCS
ncbi:nucleotidyltransferase family protein [Thermosipho atlanticus]|uniref:Molybdenum cofactor cytidylyltransferase n=1 Tax=Thermosipho atlanticus DSM 15807 TaxID=1123380 RepID=A0A1M5QXP7_9BACT|nr:nucleotidyltransferase family protein [Thermosipho atlanticus]SHH18530.1 molybdenum cofactor cytidylyltransferase [Thermosipho atlanticus DSM 15807]